MPAFMDATCPKCSKRIGWAGEMKDRPPCPRCGHQLSPEKMEADAAEVERFKQYLRERKQKKDDGIVGPQNPVLDVLEQRILGEQTEDLG